MPSFSDYIVFVDESGDHHMEMVDPQYPMFVLAFCVFEKGAYADIAAPAVIRFKFRFFGHDQVVLHEMDIRKSKGPFARFRDARLREPFMTGLNELIHLSPFFLIACAVHKQRHKERYVSPIDPYHIAMGFGLERLFLELDGRGCQDGLTHVVFEKRGATEDGEAELEFRRVCDGHNALARRLPFEAVFVEKKCNSPGLQIADLLARPIGRKVLNPREENRAYDIIHPKFRRSPGGRLDGWGLKVFP